MQRTYAIQLARLIKDIGELTAISKITGTFIKAMKEGSVGGSVAGYSTLHGNFNIGGTVSGRMSSSGPNLQNLPSGSKYGKVIKRCFVAPPGWVLVGADFASLEDRISALTTGDSNKQKVYTDGYDGHCLRAFSYFKDEMPDIVDTVESINSIESKYSKQRKRSKAPTFLLTYGGTRHGLMHTVGLSEDEAIRIETQYHELYAESDDWVRAKLEQASKDGYVTLAFGLKLLTPILVKTLLNKRVTPYAARAESRTAGNALGQGYGLLTTRAGIEFQERCFDSEQINNVMPVAQIHDALYYLVREDADTLAWVNKHLIECMAWQELPELHHEEIKLEAALEIYYPSWAENLVLPNKCTAAEISQLISNYLVEKEA